MGKQGVSNGKRTSANVRERLSTRADHWKIANTTSQNGKRTFENVRTRELITDVW
jgi:hypothetical protein